MYNTNYITDRENNTGIYIRLSQEDKDKKYESDSESVSNQREILQTYCYNNKYHIVDEYVDDGYSGTNFDRPGFKRMMDDIYDGRINMVVVKDLSRLGRDHVGTGKYVEEIFPELNVRFISIMEGVDTFKESASNDSSTFIIAVNDFYSKQNSTKIKSVLKSKRQKGKFVGSSPCFGYMRDPDDKGHLIPNPETAHIVKEIFEQRANKIGVSEITTYLNDKGYPTPSAYKDLKKSCRLINKDMWTISSVKKILCNQMYVGDMVQHVQVKRSYKSEKKVTLDRRLWDIVPNTHEALIDRETFEIVQNLTKDKFRNRERKTDRERRLLEGLLYCKECKNKISVYYKKDKDYWTVNCNKYARDPKRALCYPHFFPYNYLEKQILNAINKALKQFINILNIDDLNAEIKNMSLNKNKDIYSELDRLVKEKEMINKKIKMAYEDRITGILSPDMYLSIAREYERDLILTNDKIDKKEHEISELNKQLEKIPDYTDQIKELLNLKEPNSELLNSLIERIEIDKDRNINIRFKYNIVDDYCFKYSEKETKKKKK